MIVLEHYGCKCQWPDGCDVTDIDMLQVDHINGGGNKHRREINNSFFGWLIKNNYMDKNGNPNLPNMTYDEMVKWSKIAMKECYFNLGFARRIMFKPHEINRLLRSAFYLSYYIFFKRSDLPEDMWLE